MDVRLNEGLGAGVSKAAMDCPADGQALAKARCDTSAFMMLPSVPECAACKQPMPPFGSARATVGELPASLRDWQPGQELRSEGDRSLVLSVTSRLHWVFAHLCTRHLTFEFSGCRRQSAGTKG